MTRRMLLLAACLSGMSCAPVASEHVYRPPPAVPEIAPASVAPAEDAEQRAAIQVWIDCLKQNARRLDDRRSDAQSIALGVAAACSSEAIQLAKIAGRGNYQLERGMRQMVDDEGPKRAMVFVLQGRRADRQ